MPMWPEIGATTWCQHIWLGHGFSKFPLFDGYWIDTTEKNIQMVEPLVRTLLQVIQPLLSQMKFWHLDIETVKITSSNLNDFEVL